jgi:hypothetical protein
MNKLLPSDIAIVFDRSQSVCMISLQSNKRKMDGEKKKQYEMYITLAVGVTG